MSTLVLDSEAFSQVARSRAGQRPGTVLAALVAAVELGSDVLVPAAVLAGICLPAPVADPKTTSTRPLWPPLSRQAVE